ncbi:MAG: hypothetical protein R3C56_36550 [Pirellulaceae bacterium]
MADGQAILETGPAAGSHVVVAGAAELFGTEFGTESRTMSWLIQTSLQFRLLVMVLAIALVIGGTHVGLCTVGRLPRVRTTAG